MSDRPRGDPGWAWYEREVARLETALAEEREKNERLRDRARKVTQGSMPSAIRGISEVLSHDVDELRAALASTGSEE